MFYTEIYVDQYCRNNFYMFEYMNEVARMQRRGMLFREAGKYETDVNVKGVESNIAKLQNEITDLQKQLANAKDDKKKEIEDQIKGKQKELAKLQSELNIHNTKVDFAKKVVDAKLASVFKTKLKEFLQITKLKQHLSGIRGKITLFLLSLGISSEYIAIKVVDGLVKYYEDASKDLKDLADYEGKITKNSYVLPLKNASMLEENVMQGVSMIVRIHNIAKKIADRIVKMTENNSFLALFITISILIFGTIMLCGAILFCPETVDSAPNQGNNAPNQQPSKIEVLRPLVNMIIRGFDLPHNLSDTDKVNRFQLISAVARSFGTKIWTLVKLLPSSASQTAKLLLEKLKGFFGGNGASFGQNIKAFFQRIPFIGALLGEPPGNKVAVTAAAFSSHGKILLNSARSRSAKNTYTSSKPTRRTIIKEELSLRDIVTKMFSGIWNAAKPFMSLIILGFVTIAGAVIGSNMLPDGQLKSTLSSFVQKFSGIANKLMASVTGNPVGAVDTVKNPDTGNTGTENTATGQGNS